MNNKVIKCESEEHGKKIREYFKGKGIDTGEWDCNSDIFYYGIVNGEFTCLNKDELTSDITVITLPKELTFPREMNVWDDEGDNKYIKIIEAYTPHLKFKYWTFDESDDNMVGYKHASEIEVPKVTEFTLQEIADKMGVSVETIRIKD